MKKISKKIALLLFALLLIYTSFCAKPAKAVSTTLSASNASVTSGGTFTITVSSSIKLSGWTISLTNNGGCTFSSASGGEVSGNSVYGTSTNGTTSLATYTFKAPTVEKDTTYTISFSGTNMCDATDDVNLVNSTSCSTTVTVKTKSTNSSSSSNKTTSSSGSSSSSSNSGSTSSSSSSNNKTTTKTPTFTSVNKTVYTTNSCNLRSSWSTSSSATPVAEGTELKLTGTSTETINGYVWYRVTYNGATKYIASSLVTETKPKEDDDDDKSNNKNLSSLSIEGIELTPTFNKETTQYTAKVDGDVTELKIDAKAEDSKAKVAIEGNEGLKEGDNIIKVKVTAEDDTTRTYFITVTVGEGITTDNTLKLSSLNIERVDFDEIFNPDTYTYKLSLNTYVDSLEITATPSQADATVEITGNSNFIAGTNTVTILLTSADGTQTAIYQIQVELPEDLVEENSEPNSAMYIVIGVIIAVAIILIILFIVRYRTTKKGKILEDEGNIDMVSNADSESENELEDSEQNDKKETREQEEETDVELETEGSNVQDEINEEQEKPKKSKGRHSK